MDIFVVDDTELHRSVLERMLITAYQTANKEKPNITFFENGKLVVDKLVQKKPNLVTLDINMPVLDGLSALALIRKTNKSIPIIMASSEDENKIGRLAAKDNSGIDAQKKQLLLKKVVDRVLSGQKEPGKLNSILEAAAQLQMDPIKIAKGLGCNAYLHKPYDAKQVEMALRGCKLL